ncbi:hypothetical protein LuPra_04277 [Luteitalea pratensis]|uniref:Bacterioferritin (Cytochrome b1) n=1 Tax=Luteitalea pratensis TaxID=1855912 RepID=A0A143PS90_LUTPR|nr:ferritin-like domain-containing protein [Luteitalea pratensis]AMY11033.1 hypothetical protein LuPra_04277 [Luteitalea pratensis]
MKLSATLSLLQELYRERLALFDRHIKGAQAIADYEFNNTYQYVIGREEHHLQWVRKALEDLGGTPDSSISALTVPAGKGKTREDAVLQDDARQQQAFVDKWAGRIEGITNARHRTMLTLMLGEMREHLRFFELALQGRDDLLGRRMEGASTGDGVMSVRWVE